MVNFTKPQITEMDARGVEAKFIMRGSVLNKEGLPEEESRKSICRMMAKSTGAIVCSGEGHDELESFGNALNTLTNLPMVNYNEPAKQLADKQAEIDDLKRQLAAATGGRMPEAIAALGPKVDANQEVRRRGRPRKQMAPVDATPAVGA